MAAGSRTCSSSLGVIMFDLPKMFLTYVAVWERLSSEYDRTPDWRFIRKQRLLNEMHRLNKKYGRWLDARLNKGL